MASLTTVKPRNIDITGDYVVNSISASGNVSAGNIKSDHLLYANGVAWSFGSGTTYANSNVAAYLPTYTGDFTAGNVSTSGNITAAYFIGNGSQLTGLPASYANSNVQAYLPTYSGLISGTLSTQSQPNITSTGTLISLDVTGNVSSGGNIIGNGQYLTSINGSNVTGTVGNASHATVSDSANSVAGGNVSGQVGNALVAGTVYSNAQPNITSVGTLSGLTVTGLITATAGGIKVGNLQDTSGTNTIQLTNGNILVTGDITAGAGGTGNVTATYFIGNGSQLTGLPASYSNTNVAAYLPTYTGNVSANYFIGNGSTLTHITGGNVDGQVGNALIAGTVYTAAQPNITSVGTLTSVVVSTTANIGTLNATDGAISGNVVISGNLTVNGATEYTNVTNIYVKDPIIEMGGGTNNAPLASNDGKDRGTLLHYYTTKPVDAFMGWDNSNAEFAFGSNVTVSSEVATFNSFGNVRAGYFIGDGSTLTNLTGANVSGQVGNALVAGTVYSNAQPNITSLGSLSSLTVTGTLSLNDITKLYIPGGTNNYVLKTDGSGNLSWVAQTSSGNASIGGSNTQVFFNDGGSTTLGASAGLTFNKGTNTLTSTNLVVSGTTNLGIVGNITITGGSANNYLKTDGAGTLSWATLPTSSLAVDSFTGNNVQTAFTLSTTPTNANYTIVSVAGVMQPKTTYSVTGNVLTFTEAPPSTAPVEITTFSTGVSAPTGGGGSGYTYSGISANTTLTAAVRYIVNTSASALTLTLPASATLGDEIGIIDGTGTAATNNLTINPNGGNIMGSSGNMIVSTNRAAFTLVYYNATQGWLLTQV